jgi:hypothetical protein
VTTPSPLATPTRAPIENVGYITDFDSGSNIADWHFGLLPADTVYESHTSGHMGGWPLDELRALAAAASLLERACPGRGHPYRPAAWTGKPLAMPNLGEPARVFVDFNDRVRSDRGQVYRVPMGDLCAALGDEIIATDLEEIECRAVVTAIFPDLGFWLIEVCE